MFLEERVQVLCLQEAKCETAWSALDRLHPRLETGSLSVLAVALVAMGTSASVLLEEKAREKDEDDDDDDVMVAFWVCTLCD